MGWMFQDAEGERGDGRAGAVRGGECGRSEIHVTGRRVNGWKPEDGVALPVPVSPVESSEPVEELVLIPYGAAKLRITAFPELKG